LGESPRPARWRAGSIRGNSVSDTSAINSDDAGDRNDGGVLASDGITRNSLIAVGSVFGGGGLEDCDGAIENNTICDNAANGGGMQARGTGGD
jgi:hypothetical protein